MKQVLEIATFGVATVLERERLAVNRLGSKARYLILPSLALMSGMISFLAFPFDGATDAYGLGMGGAALVYFSWSMILASRLQSVEWLFGGFDRVHLWHRLFSMLALLTMWLHGMAENAVAQGLTSFGIELEELGYELAGLAQNLFVALAVVSIFRILPYQVWKLSHKLFIAPFALGAFHFFTSESTFSIFSPWGFYFSIFVAVGLVSFIFRLLVIDTGWTFRNYKVCELDLEVQDAVIVKLAATRRGFRAVRPGSFVFVRFTSLGREVHPFSVAGWANGRITLTISKTGDWTNRLSEISVGQLARVSRPLGSLQLDAPGLPARLWVAAGSGIAPFLGSQRLLSDNKPTKLVYSYRNAQAIGLEQLRTWAAIYPNFELVEINTGRRDRLTEHEISELVSDPNQWVVACGPEGMIQSLKKLTKHSGAPLEFELFDYRLAYDLRNPIERILDFVESRTPLRLGSAKSFVRRG